MKHLAVVLGLIFSISTLAAGVTYDFQSKSNAAGPPTVSGTVSSEGSKIRLDITKGDGFIFQDRAFVLSSDGGKTLLVFDPAAKTYFSMDLNELLGASGSLLKTVGGMVKLSFSNPKVSVRDLGEGETVSGYPTRHAVVNAEYDIAIDAMGNKMATHMAMSTESWLTDRLPAESMNFLQMKNFHTGYADLDDLIDAQSKAINGRFPLKQVTTIHASQGTGQVASTTTSEVTHIEKKTIPASRFATPNGYVKVDDPMTRMMKNLK